MYLKDDSSSPVKIDVVSWHSVMHVCAWSYLVGCLSIGADTENLRDFSKGEFNFFAFKHTKLFACPL